MLRPAPGWRSCRKFMFLMAGFVLWTCPIPIMAADTISDPKAWADAVVDRIAARDTEGILKALVEGANDGKKPESIKVQLAQLWEMLPRVGEISSIDSIAQREWGKSLVMYWYYLDFKEKVMIVSLRLGKHGNEWHLSQFNFTTEIDNAKLP